MPRETRRKTPEELLREVQAEAAALKTRGISKSSSAMRPASASHSACSMKRGAAASAGRMWSSGRSSHVCRRKWRRLAAEAWRSFRSSIDGGAAIDVEAILKRRPAVCVIDGLAYDNPPGSRNPTRWQDVQDLLDGGIKVIASINVQYVAELREQVEEITGKEHYRNSAGLVHQERGRNRDCRRSRRKNPSSAHPRRRLTPTDGRRRLSKLRELALVLAADVVDFQLRITWSSMAFRQQFGAHERILVCITPRANVEEMIETARIDCRKVSWRSHRRLCQAARNLGGGSGCARGEVADCARCRSPHRDSGGRRSR